MSYKDNLQFWLNNAPEHVVEEINNMSEEDKELAFHKDIEFGTAGIRGPIIYGSNFINEYVIQKFAKALGLYLLEVYGEEAKQRGIVIGHDNRKKRYEFSEAAAETISALGIPVYLYKDNELQPTPLVSWTIAHGDYIGGAIVTASHNPPTDNGFKVYGEEGSQMLPTSTNRIQEISNDIKDIFNIERSKDNVHYLDDSVVENYTNETFNAISTEGDVDRKDLKVVFTSQHGTAGKIGTDILNRLNVDLTLVEEQIKPDENFTHTEVPNPQDPRSFNLAKEYGDRVDADILVGTDPDADRFAVVVKHNGEWVHINGNELPVLQILYKLRETHTERKEGDFIAKSIVSTSLANKIAEKEGVEVLESLTGFKWIINDSLDKIKQGGNYLFGFEESYGSVVDAMTRDKDSFQAFIQVIEMVYKYKQEGKTLVDKLNEIFEEFGYYIMDAGPKRFEGLQGQKDLEAFIDKFRAMSPGDKVGELEIEEIIDFKKGYKHYQKDNIVFVNFKGGDWMVLRPSGTEPLLRIYWDVSAESKEEAERKESMIKDLL